ncbi:carboxypeptidase-like regulatory domain-containing protein [Pedobacter namyangjuensis]|uniref:carboxypeptidase-like regulatory domain-containing protein n=1 Tax=Pedobacter namyangjuensis TaxID=600626 RepID=UPI000DE487A2|nr:carboxypeptidase-like regulatory domain-containing protein [Pedobacter namyangjuensis]
MSYNEWLDIDVLEDYLDGKLDAKAMHQVEKLSLEDPFVAEALAGLSQSPKRTQNLSLLQKQLQQRVAQKPVEQKRWRLTSHRLSIAATAAVLFVTVSVLFWLKGAKQDEMLTGQPKNIEVAIAPQTSKGETKNAKALSTDKNAEQAKVEQAPIVATTIKPRSAKTVPVIEQQTPLDVPSEAKAEASAMMLRRSEEKVAKNEAVDEIIVNAKKEAVARETIQQLQSRAPGVSMNTNNIFRGKVYDKNGVPVPGASVKIEGRNVGTVTDRNGDFRINGDSSERLAVAYLGFNTKTVDARSNQPINVQLEPNTSALNEVVVVGGDVARKVVAKTVAVAVPEKGWANYEAYLTENNQLLKKGKTDKEVVLGFVVDKKGLPTQIKIVKSADAQMDKEAIRLLQNGPKWNVKDGEITNGQIAIKF